MHARIEVFRREREHWDYDVAEADDKLTLADRFEIEVDRVYEGIFELPPTIE